MEDKSYVERALIASGSLALLEKLRKMQVDIPQPQPLPRDQKPTVRFQRGVLYR